MGSAVEVPGVLECMRMLDGRRMGESAVVRRRLRSELPREDDESARGGRLGSVYRDEEACGGSGGSGAFVLVVVLVLERGGWLTCWSAKKSIHVSPSRPLGGC
jgi:hypothetical protein